MRRVLAALLVLLTASSAHAVGSTIVGSVGSGTLGTASTTYYAPLTTGFRSAATAAETYNKFRVLQGNLTLKDFTVWVNSNPRTTATTAHVRVNGAATSQAISIPSTTTGLFQDSTNTDSLATNDEFSSDVVTGTGTGALGVVSVVAELETTSGATVCPVGASSAGASLTQNLTRYVAPVGVLTLTATEANAQYRVHSPGTIKGLQFSASAALTTGTVTATLMVNGSPTALTKQMAAATPGFYIDDANTVHVDEGDLVDVRFVSSAGTGTASLRSVGYYVESDDGQCDIGASAPSKVMNVANTRFPILGDLSVASTSTTNWDISAPFTTTVGSLRIYVSARTNTQNIVFTLMKNNVATDLVVNVEPASGAGWFESDPWSSEVSVTAGDLLALNVTSSAAFSATMQVVGVALNYVEPATTTTTTLPAGTASSLVGNTASSTFSTASTTYAAPFGNGLMSSSPPADTYLKFKVLRGDLALANASAWVETNTRASRTSAAVRKNGTATSQSVDIPWLTAGEFTDALHSDTLVADDTFSAELMTRTGSGTLGQTNLSAELRTLVDPVVCVMQATGTVSVSAGSQTFVTVAGDMRSSSREGDANYQYLVGAPGTIKGLQFAASTALTTGTTTVTLRVNGVATALTQTMSAATPGFYMDEVHSVHVDAGDLIGLHISNSAGTGSISLRSIGYYVESDDGQCDIGSAGFFAYDNYLIPIIGDLDSDSSVIVPFATTVGALRIRTLRSDSAGWTFTLRINGVATSMAVTVPMEYGDDWYEVDPQLSEAVAAGDVLDVLVDGTGSYSTAVQMGLTLNYVVPATTTTTTMPAGVGSTIIGGLSPYYEYIQDGDTVHASSFTQSRIQTNPSYSYDEVKFKLLRGDVGITNLVLQVDEGSSFESDIVFTLMKNGAPTSQSITVTPENDGLRFPEVPAFEELSAGDFISTQYESGPRTGSWYFLVEQQTAELRTLVAPVVCVRGSAGTRVVAGDDVTYLPLAGDIYDASTYEPNVQTLVEASGTIKALQFYVSDSRNAGNAVVTLRVNGVDTALTKTVLAASAPAFYIDDANTVHVDEGDLVSVAVDTTGGYVGQTAEFTSVGYYMESDDAECDIAAAGLDNSNTATNLYTPVLGYLDGTRTSFDNTNILRVPFDTTIGALRVYMRARSHLNPIVVTLFKNGVATSYDLTIPPNHGAGWFQAPQAESLALLEGDLIFLRFTSANSEMFVQQVGLTLNYVADPTTTTTTSTTTTSTTLGVPETTTTTTTLPSFGLCYSHAEVADDIFCMVQSDGFVQCQGYNGDGQGSPPPYAMTKISGGDDSFCGIKTNGELACWGYDDYGIVSDKPTGNFTHLSTSSYTSCAIDVFRNIHCWGRDNFLQVTNVPAGEYTDVSTAYGHSCAVSEDGTIDCWGTDNGDGEATPPAGMFIQVAVTPDTSCAIRAGDHKVECWGSAYGGATAVPDYSFFSIAAGEWAGSFCGITDPDRSIACWGEGGSYGRLLAPQEGEYASVSLGDYEGAATTTDGNVVFWGYDVWVGGIELDPRPADNSCGYAGPPTTTSTLPQVECDYLDVTLGIDDAFALKTADNLIECWGDDSNGTCATAPMATPFADIQADQYHGCGIKLDGSLECWANWYGDLSVETAEPAGTNFIDVELGSQEACALRDTGVVECWGETASCNYTDGCPVEDFNTPVGTDFIQIEGHQDAYCGTRSDGTVECWGYIEDLRCVGGVTDGYNCHSIADTCEGCVGGTNPGIWCDSNADCLGGGVCETPGLGGQCDEQTDLVTNAPGTTDFIYVSPGWRDVTCGIRDDGSAFCWGSWGSPMGDEPISGLVSVETDSEGAACALTTGQDVVCWGSGGVLETNRPMVGNIIYMDGWDGIFCSIDDGANVYCWGQYWENIVEDTPNCITNLAPASSSTGEVIFF